jgi:hypothetical protein
MADGRVIAVAFLGVVLGTGIAAWFVLLRGADVAPVGPPTGMASAQPGSEGPAVLTNGDPSPSNVVERSAAGLGSVHGRVLGAAAGPIEGIEVTLWRAGVQPKAPKHLELPRLLTEKVSVPPLSQDLPWPAITTKSDAAGAFSFESQVAGDYTIAARLGSTVSSKPLTLKPGKDEVLDLQFAASDVLATITLRCNGVPAQLVTLGGDRVMTERHPDYIAPGVYRMFLPPGTYPVNAWNHPQGVVHPPLRLSAAQGTLVVSAGSQEARCELVVPDLEIAVRIDDGGAELIPGLEFEIEREGAPEQATKIVRIGGGDGRACTFDKLALGVWSVTARAPGLMPIEPQRIELTWRAPRTSVVLRAEPAGIVRIAARNGNQPVLLLEPAVPVLKTIRGELRAGSLRRGDRGIGARVDFGFASVPLGPAELQIADLVAHDRVTFLAFDPIAAPAIEVVAGDHNRVDLQVKARALVKLRATDSVGRDDLAVTAIAVRAGDLEVVSDEKRPTRWRSYLPPGDYLVAVQRGEVRTEQRVSVGRQNVDLSLRP